MFLDILECRVQNQEKKKKKKLFCNVVADFLTNCRNCLKNYLEKIVSKILTFMG